MAVPTRVSRCHDRVINGSMGTRSETPCGDSIDYHQDIQINTEPSPLKEVLEGWVTAAPQWRGATPTTGRYTNDRARDSSGSDASANNNSRGGNGRARTGKGGVAESNGSAPP
eukprot:SAG25_NODE_523_length_7209_cov_880.305204_1_plen_112_part_10